MKFRVVLLGSISAIAISASALTPASAGCIDDRYACEPSPVVEPAAPLALQPQGQQATPRKVRPLAERRTVRERHYRKASRHLARPRIVDMEKAPPDKPRELEKAPPENILPPGTLSWAPMEMPSAAAMAPFDALNRPAAATPRSDEVRVVAAEELNEIDRAAPQEPVKVTPVRFEVTQAPAGIQEASAERPAAPVDTALLERVLVTFGGAFGAASAMRLFLG